MLIDEIGESEHGHFAHDVWRDCWFSAHVTNHSLTDRPLAHDDEAVAHQLLALHPLLNHRRAAAVPQARSAPSNVRPHAHRPAARELLDRRRSVSVLCLQVIRVDVPLVGADFISQRVGRCLRIVFVLIDMLVVCAVIVGGVYSALHRAGDV